MSTPTQDSTPSATEPQPSGVPNLLVPVSCGVILLLLAAVLWAQSGRRDALAKLQSLEGQVAPKPVRSAESDQASQEAQKVRVKLEADLAAAKKAVQDAETIQKRAEASLKKRGEELESAVKERDAAKVATEKAEETRNRAERLRDESVASRKLMEDNLRSA